MTILPAFTISLFGLIHQGQSQLSLNKIEHGPTILKQALHEGRLSDDQNLPREVREDHARAYHNDIKRAYEQLLLEATTGEMESKFLLGAYYLTFDKEGFATKLECLSWLEQAAVKGYRAAPLNYALALFELDSQSEKAKGIECLKRATQIGNQRESAAVALVGYYTYGSLALKLKRDPMQAWVWARKGAEIRGCSVNEFLSENLLESPDKVDPGSVLYPPRPPTP